MKMHLESSDKHLITDYGPGSISIDGTPYTCPILVGGASVLQDWYEGEPGQLQLEDLSSVIEQGPEILIFGSGREHAFPPIQLIAELSQKGIAMEVMSTSAACRTYNVLVSEFRDVSAALLQIAESD